jgi:hypothetical protein
MAAFQTLKQRLINSQTVADDRVAEGQSVNPAVAP